VVRDVRLAFGSVAPISLRALRAEDAIRGKRLDSSTVAAAEGALLRDIAPIDDVRSTARYRATVAQNLMSRFLTMG
jgi:xanthine dehydrogenase small subunit